VNGQLFEVFEVAHLERLFDISPRKEPHQEPPRRACLWPRGWPCLNR
jgi:hypothetical protein